MVAASISTSFRHEAHLTGITKINELIPVTATLYSAFVGCTLLDCRSNFEALVASDKNAKTPLAQVNATELLEALKKVDTRICKELSARIGINFAKNESQL